MAPPGNEISVLLADGHSLFREAARRALSAQPGLDVVAEAGDGIAALNAARKRRPNVAIIDAQLPKSAGLWTSIRIGKEFRSCGIIVLNPQDDKQPPMPLSGARVIRHVAKTSPLSDLIDAIRSVQRRLQSSFE